MRARQFTMFIVGLITVTMTTGKTAADQGPVPEGLSASDWSSIRAAYEGNRHAAFAVEDGYVALNPGQQWRTRFDGRGFVTTPDAGAWSWGLELVGYGRGGEERAATCPACVDAQGQRVEYVWDAALTEWYANDARGLEHGYTVHQRPDSPALRAEKSGGPLPVAEATGNHRAPSGRKSGRDSGRKSGRDSGRKSCRHSGLENHSLVDSLVRESLRARIVVGGLSDEAIRRTISAFSEMDSWKRGCEKGFSQQQLSGKMPLPHHSDRPHLQFTLAVRGGLVPLVSRDGRNVTFVNNAGAAVVNYNGLTVFDADGAALPAWFELADGSLRLFVDDRGARYPLTIDPIAQQAYLKASNTGADDFFGYSISVSGDTVVVGAPQEDSNATGVNGNGADNSSLEAGAAYVFVRHAGGVWIQQAYLKASNTGADDNFGTSVAVSGDAVVVGAPLEDSNATGVNGNGADDSAFNSGAAYVFVRSGGVWTQRAYLKASNTGAGDNFGHAVAVSGDTLVLGARFEDSSATGVDGNQADNSAADSGAAYVFVRGAGGLWTQQAYLKASNTGMGDNFGDSVAAGGDTLVVGALGEASSATGVNGNQADNSASASGAAYVFVRDAGGVWSQQAYLKASNTDAFDLFGWSVAVAGDTVVVGAFGEDSSATGVDGNQADNNDTNAGAAYVFVRSGGFWSQQAYLKASNTGVFDNFGWSVGASSDTVAVGAPFEDSSATGVDGNQADNSAADSGAAYFFVRDAGGAWSQQAYLKASNTGANDRFGRSLAVWGDTVVVGANLEDSSATGVNGDHADNSAADSGAAYVLVIDTDDDGVPDAIDVCPNTPAGLPVDSTGRPLRDANGDCVVDGADIQIIVNELLGQ